MENNNRVYQAYYRGQTILVEAKTSYSAQLKAAALFGARKTYWVDVVLTDRVIDPASIG